jgi:CheY-like chemotaxis protein
MVGGKPRLHNASPTTHEASKRRRRVLLVEDDFDIRDALKQVLTDDGYDVAEAANGLEALSLLRSRPRFGLIVLDLMMPVMDGWQFRREQQSDPELRGVPVMVLSADANAEKRAEVLGVVDCLRKPVALDALLRSIDRHCARPTD